MEPKAAKGDTFTLESEVLNRAKAYLEQPAHEPHELLTAYSTLVEEYSKMLDEAKFITKISDKLEAKLNTANEKLQSFNDTLTNEADTAKAEKERAQQRSKELNKQREQIAKQANKQQMTIVIFVAIYAISMGLTLWFLYFSPEANMQRTNAAKFAEQQRLGSDSTAAPQDSAALPAPAPQQSAPAQQQSAPTEQPQQPSGETQPAGGGY